MDDESYRARLQEIEQTYSDAMRFALCRRQRNQAFVKHPWLIWHTPEAANAAQIHDRDVELLERSYYSQFEV